jgi:hypothetical protein
LHGPLNIYCLECHQFVSWQKSQFYLDDFYPDWRLDISCGCGPTDDPEIAAMAREAYDLQLDVELATQQQNSLDAALTKGGNLYFETLCQTANPLP